MDSNTRGAMNNSSGSGKRDLEGKIPQICTFVLTTFCVQEVPPSLSSAFHMFGMTLCFTQLHALSFNASKARRHSSHLRLRKWRPLALSNLLEVVQVSMSSQPLSRQLVQSLCFEPLGLGNQYLTTSEPWQGPSAGTIKRGLFENFPVQWEVQQQSWCEPHRKCQEGTGKSSGCSQQGHSQGSHGRSRSCTSTPCTLCVSLLAELQRSVP
jgi:hypothetical protein